MNLNDLIKRIDELIEMGNDVLTTCKEDGVEASVDWPKHGGFYSAVLSFLYKLFGPTHPYITEFSNRAGRRATSLKTMAGIEILKAVKQELAGGWLFTVKGLVSAEIFADFLDMASYFLGNGYKDPAAVMIGSTLEEHLRQLCSKHGIPIEISRKGKIYPKKADVLNADLAKAAVYNKLDQKNATAWLDLRNKAAHGKYNRLVA